VDGALVAVAGLFALFNGVNDGGALLAAGLKVSSLRPVTAVVVLSLMVGIAPALFGSRVATTLADRLVHFTGDDGQVALLAAVAGATVVVITLSRSGVPTSLTLALLGGIVGAGLGGGLPVAWTWTSLVLLLAAAAPLAGLLGAYGVARLWGALPLRTAIRRQVRTAHRVGFGLQAIAYGTNDGQKMLAVFTIAVPAAAAGEHPAARATVLIATVVLFAAGMLLGARRYGGRLGLAVLPITPVNAATARLSSAAVVMSSAAVGAPVSMTQALVGGLVGSDLTLGGRRIRWFQVGGIAVAWIVTLPTAAAVAALLASVFVSV
jgi:PiT family inorganic phosphate transporter